VAVIHTFSWRLYGMRKYKKELEEIIQKASSKLDDSVAPAIRITNYSVEGTHQGIRVNLSPKVALKWRKEE
jgi:hypothetical protein